MTFGTFYCPPLFLLIKEMSTEKQILFLNELFSHGVVLLNDVKSRFYMIWEINLFFKF